jgi:hypothetical protein
VLTILVVKRPIAYLGYRNDTVNLSGHGSDLSQREYSYTCQFKGAKTDVGPYLASPFRATCVDSVHSFPMTGF